MSKTPELKMPTPLDSMKSTAKNLAPSRGDWETLIAAGVAAAVLVSSVGILLVRLLLLAALPLSVALLYPMVRASQRRNYENSLSDRARVLAGLTKLTPKGKETP